MPRGIAAGSSISFSHDNKFMAYTVSRGHAASTQTIGKDVPWFARGTDIHAIDLTTNKEEDITGGQGSNWEPVWSPESNLLVFLSDRGPAGKTNLWLWNAADKTMKMASPLEAKSGDIAWMKDGHGVIISASISSQVEAGPPKENLQGAGAASVPGVRVYESRRNSAQNATADPWSLDDYSAELVWIDVASGKRHGIFRGRIGTYKISPDGSRLAISVPTRFENPGSQQILFDIAVLTLVSGQSQVALSDVRLGSDGSGFSWSPDSKRLCLRTNDENKDTSTYKVVDLVTSRVLILSTPSEPSRRSQRTAPVWDEVGRDFYFAHNGELWRGDAVQGNATAIVRIPGRRILGLLSCPPGRLWLLRKEFALAVTHDDNGKQDGVYEVNLTTGSSKKLMENGQCYTCVLDGDSLVVSQNGQTVVFVSEDSAHTPELWAADPEFKDLRQLTHLNPEFDSRPMGTARVIDWLSDDGERLHGALLLPANYQPGERYPLVVYVYGGVSLSDHFDRFGLAGSGPANLQLLATRGYAVLLPDAPQHVGTPMLDLAKTILAGVNKSTELGIADPDRLAVMGHSYGGYSTLCLIVQTGRFKAAISIAGGSDLFGFYGEMQDDASAYGVAIAEHGQGAMGGTPWERRERYIENSPFFYFDRIQTPVLIIQGSTDTAVAPFLGDQIFVALRRLGKEAEYAKYEGEEHSPSQEWSYEHQVDLSYRIIRWLDEHLK
jgi:dipeptidyl aminopeptidase/acylaminoacyl peptidase